MKLSRFNDFYLERKMVQNKLKYQEINESNITSFLNIVNEGKKSDFVTVYLKSKSKMNESYSLILENKEILSQIKTDSAAEYFKDGVIKLSEEALVKIKSKVKDRKSVHFFENHIQDLILNEAWYSKFLNWKVPGTDMTIGDAGKTAINALVSTFKGLSDEAKQVWNEISDFLKAGYDAFMSFGKRLFGAAFEAIKAVGKASIEALDDFIIKSKSVFDTVYKTLKDIAAKLGEIIQSMTSAVKNFAIKLWDIIKNGALGAFAKVKTALGRLGEITERDPHALEEEQKKLSQDWKAMRSGFFGGNVSIGAPGGSLEDVAQSSGGQLLSTGPEESQNESLVNEDIMWYSMMGYTKSNHFTFDEAISMHESNNETINERTVKNFKNYSKLYEAQEEVEAQGEISPEDAEGAAKKKESKGVKKWISGIVAWVLSPFGKFAELIVGRLTKVVCAIPAYFAGKLGGLWEGVKKILPYAAGFAAISAIVAMIAGIVVDALSLTGALHSSDIIKDVAGNLGSGIENLTGVDLADLPAGAKHENKIYEAEETQSSEEQDGAAEEKKHKFFNWKEILTIKAPTMIIGFMIGAFVHSVPPLHTAFEFIMVAMLIFGGLGWYYTEHPTQKSKKPEQFNDFQKGCKGFYGILHA
jgi:hypothetical protein